MVRTYDYGSPKGKVLNEMRSILISLGYEIDIYAPETYALSTKSMRLKRTLRKYDYVLFVKISDRVEVHVAAKRSIFRRGSASNLGKYEQIIQQTEDRLPFGLQQKIYKPIKAELKKNKRKNKISFY